ncbi:hypothetical protein KIN20_017459 [Parelaphostrongylus tenuis]|uniref:Uncharacterized protein n=1 Tax=Parelaphostrongylus tenuis TaxID=148309 RepID=A0AAD5MIL2_PARTN|nr:hypothetical protein KIN20_017459 [Parelaphostrongylus tenuis]
MAGWSREMWNSVVNRAVQMLASGPLRLHFVSAFATKHVAKFRERSNANVAVGPIGSHFVSAFATACQGESSTVK